MAAAAVVFDDAPPPPELRMAWRVRRWGAPYADGWMDWPAGLVDKMAIAENVYNACLSYRNVPAGGGVAWTQRNPQAWQIVSKILAQRKKKID